MRFQALAASLLASTGLATPLRLNVGQAFYTLRLTSPVTALDGLYLTTTPPSSDDANATTTLGVYSNPSTPSTPQIKFHPVRNPDTSLWELHTAGETTLAVLGANGLLDFASLSDPAATTETLPEGTLLDWTSFSLDSEAGGGGMVDYAGTVGRWVAFPTSHDPGAVKGGEGDGEMGWIVKWRNIDAWTTENYMPVQVVYELVQDE